MNITSLHQTKYKNTRRGFGFGYGDNKRINKKENEFLDTFFAVASPDVREKVFKHGMQATLNSIVPPLVRKLP